MNQKISWIIVFLAALICASRSCTADPALVSPNTNITITGTAIDESGSPVPGAVIVPRDVADFDTPEQNGTTDASGVFTLANLHPGSYRLIAGAEWRVIAPDSFKVPSATPVKLVLRKRDLTTLYGKVLDQSGAPLSGVKLHFTVLIDFREPTVYYSTPTTVTDDEGAFTLNDMPALDGGDSDSSVQLNGIDKDGYTVVSGGSIHQGKHKFTFTTAVMSASVASISGVVVDIDSRQVPSARVTCTGGDRAKAPVIVQTDSAGKFSIGSLPTGSVEVFAAKGFSHVEKSALSEATSLAHSTANIKITLEPSDGPPAPGDLKRGYDLMMNASLVGGQAVDADVAADYLNTCAAQIAAYDPKLGVKFLQDNGTKLGGRQILSLLEGRIQVDPQAALEWGYGQTLAIMPQDQYKFEAETQLGLAALPLSTSKANTLYEAASSIAPTSYDEYNIQDGMQLCALAAGLHKPDVQVLYRLVLDCIDSVKHDSNAIRAGYWRVLVRNFAAKLAPYDLRLSNQIPQEGMEPGSIGPPSYVISEQVAALASTQPATAIALLNRIPNSSDDHDSSYSTALLHVLPAIYKDDPKKALALAEGVHQPDGLGAAVAVLAELTPSIAQAAPLYREAESKAGDRFINDYTPVRIAAMAYRRDKALGTELFDKALTDFIAAQRDPQDDLVGPSTAAFAFYYAAFDPAYSRLLIERQYDLDLHSARGRPISSRMANDAAAMAAIDISRANELAYAIPSQEMRYSASLRIAQYVIAPQSARADIGFIEWVDDLGNWVLGTPKQ